MNSKRNTFGRIITAIISIAVVVGATYAVAVLSKFYYNFESSIGDEALAMMGKMKFINQYFPDFNWNYQWEGGQPGFWIYLPFPFMVGAILVKLFNFTYPFVLIHIGLFSYFCVAVGIYGITYRLTKSHLLSILASFLAMTSQGVWYWVGAGYYARTFAAGFYFLTLWAAISFLQKIEEQDSFFPLPKKEYLLTVLFFFITAYSHSFPNNLLVGTLFVLLVFCLKGWRRKLWGIFLVLGTGIALSAFYYLLMWQANFQYYNQHAILTQISPHPWRLFWNLSVFEGYSGAPEVSPLILPFFLLLFILNAFCRFRFKDFSQVDKRIFWIFSFFFLLAFIYPLQGSLFIPKMLFILLLPGDLPFFVSIFGAILIGILLQSFLQNFSKIFRYAAPIILIVLICLLTINGWLFTFDDKWTRRFTDNNEGFVSGMVIEPDSKQFRMGTTNPSWAESFNYFYDVPQNHGYFISAGSPYNDWQFWQSSRIWDIKYDYPETDFLIDWFSIKWLLSTDSGVDSSFKKFSAKPDSYELVYQKEPNFYEFTAKNVSPILQATNTPNLLVIGDQKTAYDLIIRNLALGNLNSQVLIPVRGGEFIDEYSLSELKKFEIIYLYDYQYKNQRKASELLKNYVSQGGGLIVEGVANPVLFEPLPQGTLGKTQITGDWDFKIGKHQVLEGINFKLFDKAYYNTSEPWKIVFPNNSSGFDILLSAGGKPIMLSRELGEGRIIWTGFNLNYHITANQNLEELKLLKQILIWVAKDNLNKIEKVDYEAFFIHPERREILIKSPAKAILNKEYNFPVWHAYLNQNNTQKELKVYSGGLDQQYILLPEELETPYRVVLTYNRWLAEKIGYLISGLTFLILLLYLFEGVIYPPFLNRGLSGIVGRIRGHKIFKLGENDEE